MQQIGGMDLELLSLLGRGDEMNEELEAAKRQYQNELQRYAQATTPQDQKVALNGVVAAKQMLTQLQDAERAIGDLQSSRNITQHANTISQRLNSLGTMENTYMPRAIVSWGDYYKDPFNPNSPEDVSKMRGINWLQRYANQAPQLWRATNGLRNAGPGTGWVNLIGKAGFVAPTRAEQNAAWANEGSAGVSAPWASDPWGWSRDKLEEREQAWNARQNQIWQGQADLQESRDWAANPSYQLGAPPRFSPADLDYGYNATPGYRFDTRTAELGNARAQEGAQYETSMTDSLRGYNEAINNAARTGAYGSALNPGETEDQYQGRGMWESQQAQQRAAEIGPGNPIYDNAKPLSSNEIGGWGTYNSAPEQYTWGIQHNGGVQPFTDVTNYPSLYADYPMY